MESEYRKFRENLDRGRGAEMEKGYDIKAANPEFEAIRNYFIDEEVKVCNNLLTERKNS